MQWMIIETGETAGGDYLHFFDTENVPEVGDEVNLGHMQSKNNGLYRVTAVYSGMVGRKTYPSILIERIGNIPEGEEALPMDNTPWRRRRSAANG